MKHNPRLAVCAISWPYCASLFFAANAVLKKKEGHDRKGFHVNQTESANIRDYFVSRTYIIQQADLGST